MEANDPNDNAKRHLTVESLDAATARRLAKLGRREVDVTRLQQRLAKSLDADATADESRAGGRAPYRFSRWVSPAAGVAALLAVAFILLLTFGTQPPQASAAVVELAQLHEDIVSGRVPMESVASVAEANDWIAAQRASAPSLPAHLADARVQSCCLADVSGELVAVALLRDERTTATLVVAEAPNFAHVMGTIIEIDGRTFFGHELNGTRMMMANDGDRWLCVMGDATYEQLAAIAAAVVFTDD
jgi:hypothetical protein